MKWKVVEFNSVINKIICDSPSVIVLNRDAIPMNFLTIYRDNDKDVLVFSDGRKTHNYDVNGKCIDTATFMDHSDPVPQSYEDRNSYWDLKVLALNEPELEVSYVLVVDLEDNNVFQVRLLNKPNSEETFNEICKKFNLSYGNCLFHYSTEEFNVRIETL